MLKGKSAFDTLPREMRVPSMTPPLGWISQEDHSAKDHIQARDHKDPGLTGEQQTSPYLLFLPLPQEYPNLPSIQINRSVL